MGLQYIISDEDELSECSDWLAYAFPEDEVVGFMGLYSNFDISGHHGGVIKGKTSPGIVVAGFYATGLKWQQFNKEWENTILKPNGLDFLHPSSLIAGKKAMLDQHMPPRLMR